MTRSSSRARTTAALLGVAVVLAAAAGAAWWWSGRSPRSTPAWPADSPSVILVLLDTLRADRLGLHGYGRDTSPHLDRLSGEMTVFENAYAQAPNTPPSVASILTSLYPSSHHFTGKGDRLPEAALTLAEMLQAGGYRTGAFVDAGFLRERFGLGQGFATYDDRGGGFEEILPRALRWLDVGTERPFLLLLHTYDIHTPYEDTPDPYRDAFVTTPYEGELSSRQLEDVRTGALGRGVTPEEVRHFSDLYDGGILHADALLGAFLEGVRQRGILDRSVLVISSDHGEEFMEHGSVLHDKLYRTVTRVPLLVRLPQAAGGGRRLPDVVESIDVTPTLLDIAGVPGHTGLQGRSLRPLLEGGSLAPAGALGQVTWDADLLGYYEGPHHLLVNHRTGRRELFDVAADPLEQEDLAAAGGTRAARLEEALRDRLRRARRSRYLVARATAEEELDAETRQSLRALGYLQ